MSAFAEKRVTAIPEDLKRLRAEAEQEADSNHSKQEIVRASAYKLLKFLMSQAPEGAAHVRIGDFDADRRSHNDELSATLYYQPPQ